MLELQVYNFDPCSDYYVNAYLNNAEVQKALHANPTNWSHCNDYFLKHWKDSPTTILPIIKKLIENVSTLCSPIFSRDTDGKVPVTSSRYSINCLKLPLRVSWYPWYSGNEVGRYAAEAYEGVVFATVRGAGHTVPSWQPARAFTLFISFLKGQLPPFEPTPS
ncbi:hypothetical protein L6164_031415 [Bauhinia variegata]|uniref:Uncharacterized protein n=1 Tax=Bauhinia variegata TaxID=167791 RepID=A0ACB9LG94_BAUVA|nr:hypothetical protein L6164_031415 [Bauhinia variegata]